MKRQVPRQTAELIVFQNRTDQRSGRISQKCPSYQKEGSGLSSGRALRYGTRRNQGLGPVLKHGKSAVRFVEWKILEYEMGKLSFLLTPSSWLNSNLYNILE